MRFYEKIPFEAKSLRDLDNEIASLIDTRFGIVTKYEASPILLRKNSMKQDRVMGQIKNLKNNTPSTARREHRFVVRSRQCLFGGLISWVVEEYVVEKNRREALRRCQ